MSAQLRRRRGGGLPERWGWKKHYGCGGRVMLIAWHVIRLSTDYAYSFLHPPTETPRRTARATVVFIPTFRKKRSRKRRAMG
jgi:hypothetical protein